jgi:molybdenum cofactor cytidylyltransferase
MTVAAILLAAGAGSRFTASSHKLLAVVRGRPVVVWAVEHARAAALDETIVVTGAIDLDALVPEGVTIVHNPQWAEGQATSLQAGIAAARRSGHQAVVVGLGDQPLVPPEAWRLVAATDAGLATAVIDGRRTPPVRIASEWWGELPVSGDEGARVLLRSRPDLVVQVTCPGSPVDIDTVEDLSAWN